MTSPVRPLVGSRSDQKTSNQSIFWFFSPYWIIKPWKTPPTPPPPPKMNKNLEKKNNKTNNKAQPKCQ